MADLLTEARAALEEVQWRIDDDDAQAAAARDDRAAVWAHYIAKGVPKARLAEMSGVSRAAITDALRRRGWSRPSRTTGARRGDEAGA
jgi:uncharacterized protein YjcR